MRSLHQCRLLPPPDCSAPILTDRKTVVAHGVTRFRPAFRSSRKCNGVWNSPAPNGADYRGDVTAAVSAFFRSA